MSDKMMYTRLVQDDLSLVENLMHRQALGENKDLRNALEIILSSGGKRIRPVITLLVGNMLNAPKPQLITLAASMEMLHTGTLVHDDLIDGSLLRRGHPTLNAKWSPGATVLTGDFVFAKAAELISDTHSVSAVNMFAKTLGEITSGEITQFFESKCNFNRDDYYERIYKKTASLFRTCCCAAAIISSADDETISSMCTFGYEIGMAFQILDDILDFTGEEMTIGKPVGNDLRSGLITLPVINYFENRPDDPDAQFFLNGKCDTFEFINRIDTIIDSIKNSEAISQSMKEAETFIARALDALHRQPASEERDALEEISVYIIQRKI
ncbi:MAG: polyprenyl synthetase family protein [Chloroflexi bacterium]|nr:polyprenyl synthetase family protein [Chloroflexota bacterium]